MPTHYSERDKGSASIALAYFNSMEADIKTFVEKPYTRQILGHIVCSQVVACVAHFEPYIRLVVHSAPELVERRYVPNHTLLKSTISSCRSQVQSLSISEQTLKPIESDAIKSNKDYFEEIEFTLLM